ncbi:hypothetical protein AMECASPLE_037672 [Ameca splendens]|uniref:Uncharacterized protein n=1 Tax=Ameca splendens TaxID=208324 RepID=A0ABV1AFB9_9TELE
MTVRSSPKKDHAGRMVQGFEKGQELFRRISRLLTASGSPWQRLETVNQLWDWLGLWGNVIPQSPLIPGLLRRERQRAVEEIGPMFNLIPGGPDAVGRLPPLLLTAPALARLKEEPQSAPVLGRLVEEYLISRAPPQICTASPKAPAVFGTALLGPSGFCTDRPNSTVVSCLLSSTACFLICSLRTVCSKGASGFDAVFLDSVPAQNDLRAIRLNSGSARDDLRVTRPNFVLFWFFFGICFCFPVPLLGTFSFPRLTLVIVLVPIYVLWLSVLVWFGVVSSWFPCLAL